MSPLPWCIAPLAALVVGGGCSLHPSHFTEPPWEANIVGTLSVVEQFPGDNHPRLPQRERDRVIAEHLVTGGVLDAESTVAVLRALDSAYRSIGIEVDTDVRSTGRGERTIDLTFDVFLQREREDTYRLSIYSYDEPWTRGSEPPREIERGMHRYLLDSTAEVAPSGMPSVKLR